jgi:hypothetical protein
MFTVVDQRPGILVFDVGHSCTVTVARNVQDINVDVDVPEYVYSGNAMEHVIRRIGRGAYNNLLDRARTILFPNP